MSITFVQDPADRTYAAIVTDVRDQPNAFATTALRQCGPRSIKFLYVAYGRNRGPWFQALAGARVKQLFTSGFKLTQVSGGALIGGTLADLSEGQLIVLVKLDSDLQRQYEMITQMQKRIVDMRMTLIRTVRN